MSAVRRPPGSGRVGRRSFRPMSGALRRPAKDWRSAQPPSPRWEQPAREKRRSAGRAVPRKAPADQAHPPSDHSAQSPQGPSLLLRPAPGKALKPGPRSPRAIPFGPAQTCPSQQGSVRVASNPGNHPPRASGLASARAWSADERGGGRSSGAAAVPQRPGRARHCSGPAQRRLVRPAARGPFPSKPGTSHCRGAKPSSRPTPREREAAPDRVRRAAPACIERLMARVPAPWLPLPAASKA